MSTHLKLRLTVCRSSIQAHNKLLRRARRAYIFFCRKSILESDYEWTINHVAKKMIECGMYAPNRPLKDCRYGILRQLYKFDTQGGWCIGWHEWRKEMGFYTEDFNRRIA